METVVVIGECPFTLNFRYCTVICRKFLQYFSVADEMGEYAASQGMSAEILELLLRD
jgi:hypothetical protein